MALPLCFGSGLFGQDATQKYSDNGAERQEIVEVLEFLQAQNNEQDIDLNLLTDALIDALNNPLFLNQARVQELEALPFLNPVIAQNILKYITENGSIKSYSELLRIDGISLPLARIIQSYTTLDSKALIDNDNFKNTAKGNRTEISLLSRQDFPARQGFDRGKFPGAPRRYYTRVTHTVPGLLKAGYIGEQDAGEKFKSAPDYNSLYAKLKLNKGILKEVLIGDYHINFAQNVLIGPTFALGKSPYIASWYRSGNSIKANTSASEIGFRRGLATVLEYKGYKSNVFISESPLDASIDSTNLTVNSINISGLHRTETELSRRKSAKQQLVGTTIEKAYGNLELGFGGLLARQRLTNIKNSNSNFDKYASANVKYRLNSGLFFSELAYDFQNKSIGALAGLIVSLAPELNFAATYRNYAQDYNNPFSNALASSSRSNNEKGILTGLEFTPRNNLVFSTYVDYYQQAENSELANSQSQYHSDVLLQIRWFKKRTWELYARLRKRIDPSNTAIVDDEKLRAIEYKSSESLRLNAVFNPSSEWRLSQRLQYSFSEGKNNGILLYADVQWRPKESDWAIDARYAVFDTDGFDGRIYAYESSLPYSFSIPAYFNRGTRKYIKVRYKGIRNLSIWLLFGIWDYEDVQQISSGDALIDSDKRKEIGLTLRYRL